MSMRRFLTANPRNSSTRNHVSSKQRRRRASLDQSAKSCESLETRTMLCGASWDVGAMVTPIEERPDLVGKKQPTLNLAGEPANIVWVNRGTAGDGFDARFGTLAPTARGVVDAVIDYYELMIGSFNYSTAGATYSLTLSMGASGSGFGASAGLNSLLAGKPKSGSINMGAGNGSANANDDNGWFIDPTPYDNSEFMGTIVNAFAGDAQAGSPALGRGDFFSVVAAEMTHCMGLFGASATMWSSHTTNTGQPDSTAGPGFYWVFQGPSIKHLMTSDNAGSQDFGAAIHSAEPSINVTFNGEVYAATQDQGNAFYENSRRYMVNNAFALMFKDAYGYSTIDPSRFGTFYSSPFQAADGVVRVRGGAGTSNDNIQIFRSAGNTITISVNIGNDVPGTGALPGAGNLPAFTSVYDVSQVSSIIIDAGAGDDDIFIDDINFDAGTVVAESFIINGDAGNDSLTTTFFGANLDSLTGAITFNGGTGTDQVVLYDNGATFSDTYTVTNTLIDRTIFGGLNYSGTESLYVNGQTGGNTFNVSSAAAGVTYGLDGRAGNDVFNIGLNGGNASAVLGSLILTGDTGTDTVFVNDFTNASPVTYGLTNTAITHTGAGTWSYNTAESMTINGGSANDTFNLATSSGNIPVTIFGANGNDVFDINTAGYTVLGAQPGIFVEAGGGADIVTLHTASGGFFYNVTTLSFTGTFLPEYGYNNNLESLVFDGGTGGETFLLFETRATLTTTVNANAGADSIYFGGFFGATYTLDTILGPVFVNGGADGDVMGLIDTQEVSAITYTVTSTNVTRTGAANISYATIESVQIFGGSANDTFTVNSTAVGAPVSLVGNNGVDSFSVVDNAAGAFVTIDGSAGLDTVSVNTDTVGVAEAHFNNNQDLALLTISTGGLAVMETNGSRIINTQGLNLAGSGRLDLNDNDLLLDYSGATQYNLIQSKIASGRNGGLWNGSGIISSAAKNRVPKNTTLGILEGADFKAFYGAGALFDGQALDTSSVLVKYTWYGDSDFNGVVNFDDYSRIDAGFGASRTGWVNGDFDGNGLINFDDYSLIDLAFNSQVGTL